MLRLSAMLSVAIPTLNHERALVPTLAALVPAAADGLLRDVVVTDGGSTDATLEIADLAGCEVARGGPDRGQRLAAAARAAKGPWLMFLEPGVVLEDNWRQEVGAFMAAAERSSDVGRRAATFSFAQDGFGRGARLAEARAALSRLLTGLPRREQGLIIHRSFYDSLGGFRPLSAMAEADLVRRIGAGRLTRLRARALAPAASSDAGRPAGPKAALCAGLLMLRVPPRVVAKLYG